jgi:hypothetical protein
VSRGVAVGRAIEDILLLAEYSLDGKWEGRSATCPCAKPRTDQSSPTPLVHHFPCDPAPAR